MTSASAATETCETGARGVMPHSTIRCACPFCGERQHLSLGPTFQRPVVATSDTLRNESGDEVLEEVPGVACQVCEAMAPLDVWNRERPPQAYKILRDFNPPSDQVVA